MIRLDDLALFARSTRSLRLTPAGEQYLPFANEALQALRDGQDVAAGKLEVILEPFRGERVPLNLVCAHRKQFSPAIRRLYEDLLVRCRELQQAYEDVMGPRTV